MPAGMGECVGEVRAGGEMRGIERGRCAKTRHGRLRPLERGQRVAQVVVIDRLVGLECDRRADLRDGERMLAALVRDQPEQVRGIGIARIEAQDRAVAPLGAGEIAAFVQPDRRLQRRGAAAAEPRPQRAQQWRKEIRVHCK